MSEQLNRNYIFLDTQAEREQLIDQIRQVRAATLQMVDVVPRDAWYQPRYHGWSLAAMLGHLHLSDNLTILNIQMGLIGLTVPVSSGVWNRMNDFTARVFKGRIVETTVRGIQKNEARIAKFILQLPVDKFSRRVYDPPIDRYLTVEQAVQEFFLFHWQDHLRTMHIAEGIYIEPPENPDMVV